MWTIRSPKANGTTHAFHPPVTAYVSMLPMSNVSLAIPRILHWISEEAFALSESGYDHSGSGSDQPLPAEGLGNKFSNRVLELVREMYEFSIGRPVDTFRARCPGCGERYDLAPPTASA